MVLIGFLKLRLLRESQRSRRREHEKNVKFDRRRRPNPFKIQPRSPKIALRSSSGALRSDESCKDRANNAQERAKSHPRAPKKAVWEAKSKKISPHDENHSPDGGGRRLRGGWWRGKGRQAPRVRRLGWLSRTLRSRRKRRVRRIELASHERRTLVGVRRWRHGAAGKFSP